MNEQLAHLYKLGPWDQNVIRLIIISNVLFTSPHPETILPIPSIPLILYSTTVLHPSKICYFLIFPKIWVIFFCYPVEKHVFSAVQSWCWYRISDFFRFFDASPYCYNQAIPSMTFVAVFIIDVCKNCNLRTSEHNILTVKQMIVFCLHRSSHNLNLQTLTFVHAKRPQFIAS